MKRPAIFLDRDGVINELIVNCETGYLDSPMKICDVKLCKNAREAIIGLHKLGYYIFIITNQPAAAKGKIPLSYLKDINCRVIELVGKEYIDDLFACYHYPKHTVAEADSSLIAECECRKPKPGLLFQARDKYDVDINNSFIVGDTYTDVLAGRNAGVKTVFLGNYKCETCKLLGYTAPDIIVDDLKEFYMRIKNCAIS